MDMKKVLGPGLESPVLGPGLSIEAWALVHIPGFTSGGGEYSG